MFSMPPASMTDLWPRSIDCAAIITAFIPDAQTLFTVVAGVSSPIFTTLATCLAGAYPMPAYNTAPMYISSTSLGFTPV